MTLRTIEIGAVNVKEFTFKDKKTGEPTKGWNVGLKIEEDQWINGAVFIHGLVETFQKGKKMEVDMYTEEYKGKVYKKFRLPRK
jgi:hypothetical protein